MVTTGRPFTSRGVVVLSLLLAACSSATTATSEHDPSVDGSTPDAMGLSLDAAPSPGARAPAPDGGTTTTDAGSSTQEAGTTTTDAGSSMQEGGSVVTPGNATCGTVHTNPITALSHDPSPLAKEGNTYYLYSTCQTAAGCATSPKLIPFQASTDLLNWRPLGNAMSAIPAWVNQLGLSGAPDIWAPDVHVVNGRAYLYYAVSHLYDNVHSAIGLMTNAALDPAATGYRWIDQGKVVGAPEGGNGVNIIDPGLFLDEDGRWWLSYGSFNSGVRAIELDPATGKARTPIVPAALTSGLGEGSDIIKNNGYYYLFLSSGRCCSGLSSTYEIVYGRATNVTGPYLNRSGGSINGASEHLLPPGSDGNPAQGGQSFFKENNQFYMVYHAYQPPTGNPTLNVRPIYFDANDWVTLDPCKAKGYKP